MLLLLLFSTFIFIFTISWRWYHFITTNWNKSYTCLFGKTVIITGATSGIGFYVALDFAKRGARLILACRNKISGEKERKEIINLTGNKEVYLKIVDLNSLQSIRDFVKNVHQTENRLDLLINNAGVFRTGIKYTSDGLEETMQVNYFGPFLLTYLLTDLLKKTSSSRIVNVTSRYHFHGLDFSGDDMNLNSLPKSSFRKCLLYSKAKFCSIIFSNELSRKLIETSVTSVAVHPGSANTKIIKFDSLLTTSFIVVYIVYLLLKISKTPEEASQAIINVALSKEVEKISGKYYDVNTLTKPYKMAEDPVLARKIWEKTEEFVKITNEERNVFNNS